MRKRRPEPDNRPDWRDPNMPCYAFHEECTPELMRMLALECMDHYDACPGLYWDENWRNDPTYNLRVRK